MSTNYATTTMAQVDYQAHNFTCYTVPECSSNDELELPGENYGSQCSLNSTESTTSSIDNNILRKHHQQIKYYKKFFNPYVTATTAQQQHQQRISMPLIVTTNSLNTNQLHPYNHYVNSPYQLQLLQQHQQHQQFQEQHIRGQTQSPQLGYFVPFAPNCYFSPPVQRKRYRDKENDRNRRAVSYGGITNSTSMTTLPRAAPRRVNLMKDPPPPPPPKPLLLQQTSIQSSTTSNTSSLSIPSKYPQSEYNLITKLESTTTSSLTAPSQYQAQNFYANASTIAAASSNNYSSLLCHASSTSSPLAVRKREKLLHRFSDAATLGRKLKKKKNTNRTCRSMTEAIEMLADPVIEDEFFVSTFLFIINILF
ncbi:dual specificity protein kinase splA-like [Lucilia cuprina]|uniref:dual specificity protein kinase splA-like n=1 Tax=Lucilia cuprina TaxID=7375 RepID=UPI001F06E82C|nr:dual specificity protein kinase splA-like [Lucilia cuprina]XP_046804203.1 dual specificity protein kinase splA-like [Lucilia cuprina]XP_046804204.1 dual specificity protein kinase splA-like [Lucilia cuprina]XP_046804205.1 dual specificity protein kinase splA-like [Lucilia cuprina]XP_046804206.1 dual specificity protein kinase splA-like [Lucilia cuprina]XP_046804207.1 dual specificity protein kinase splA-like [Lucilia cuprina]XP_046804208.1 dual specificity protein kinase splA-like [Lucilia